MMRHVPNILTFLRLATIPVLVVLLHDPSQVMIYAALAIFIIAAITDYVDGMLARRFGAVTDFGKLLDPLADKLLVLTVLIMLVSLKSDELGNPWVSAWMVVLIVVREFWVTGLRAVAASNGKVIAARDSGKLKSALQMFAIIALLLHNHYFLMFDAKITAQFIGESLLLLSIIFSYWGGAEYTLEVLGKSA